MSLPLNLGSVAFKLIKHIKGDAVLASGQTLRLAALLPVSWPPHLCCELGPADSPSALSAL